eukprot:12821094-Heterocapsa_arctica.AAC.1
MNRCLQRDLSALRNNTTVVAVVVVFRRKRSGSMGRVLLTISRTGASGTGVMDAYNAGKQLNTSDNYGKSPNMSNESPNIHNLSPTSP